MAQKDLPSASSRAGRRQRVPVRFTDSFGLVLLLILLDYLAISTLSAYLWGDAITIVLLGSTLLFALRTSHSQRIWQLLAILFVVVALIGLAIVTFAPGGALAGSTATLSLSAGVLLIVTPVAILRRIIRHTTVTVETILGAVSVYLLLGFSFASIYAMISLLSSSPFFVDYPTAQTTDYLFFSYTTLTTVGYGNLVPAGNIGRMFAMIEALLGQIYLVIVVARLVSLWGGQPPSTDDRPASDSTQSAPVKQKWNPSVHRRDAHGDLLRHAETTDQE